MTFDKTTPYQKLKQHLQSIPDKRDRALFCTQYANYARIGEIVRGRHSENPPLSKSRMSLSEKHLTCKLLTEKINRWRKTAVSRRKEEWLVKIVWDYAQECFGDELFPISTRRAQTLFSKHFSTGENENTHLLRHWAITHALQGHKSVGTMGPLQVARLAGITDLKTLRNYSHLVLEDFIDDI